MAKVNFKRISNSSQINNLPIEDGSFIITGDGKSYIDFGNNRVPTNGTLDDEMSDLSSNAVENKVIKEYVDDAKQDAIDYGKPIVLWENTNPNNEFPSQQITLASSDYNYLEIYYYDWASDPASWKDVKCVKTLKGYHTVLEAIISYDGKAHIGARRARYVNNTRLQFDDCYALINANTFSSVSVDAWCVPVKILGYK